MDTILLPILVAAAVGALAWWVAALVAGLFGGNRKLRQRLATDATGGADGAPEAAGLSILLPDEGGKVPEFLARKPFVQTLRRRLSHAFPETTLRRFVLISGGCALLLAAVTFGLSASTSAALAAFAVGGYAPLFVLNLRCNRRVRTITRQLPEALDFLARIMRAGHSLSTGLQMMSDELPPPLSAEFRKAYDGHSLGQPLEEALRDMAGRIDSTDFSFFVTAVLIQRQTGGDLTEVLTNISGMIRQRSRLGQQVKAKTAEGRLTGYVMVAFPAIMFGLCYFFNPELYGGFARTNTGMVLLGVAVGLQLLGLFMIRKITTVRV